MALSNFTDSSDGDNKEFTVVDISDVTIYIDHANTSANDTATKKYFDNNLSDIGAASDEARAYCLRTDQPVLIVGINNTTFTDPILVSIGDGSITPATGIHTETFEKPWVRSIIIRTTVANTNIKLRVR